MSVPTCITFATEEDLQDYAEKLNELGIHPDVAIIDSNNVQVLASRTAPGGDGWGWAYFAPGEDGFMHCCTCAEHWDIDCPERSREWKPAFPIYAMERAS